MVDRFLTKMYRNEPDFVFTVSRDFVKQLPDTGADPAGRHPGASLAVAMEAAMLAPKGEVTMFPWKEPKEPIPLALRQVRSFIRAGGGGGVWHRPATASP